MYLCNIQIIDNYLLCCYGVDERISKVRINPVLNLNLKNRNYLIQKNSSKPSFKAMDDVFISGLIQKEDKLIWKNTQKK